MRNYDHTWTFTINLCDVIYERPEQFVSFVPNENFIGTEYIVWVRIALIIYPNVYNFVQAS